MRDCNRNSIKTNKISLLSVLIRLTPQNDITNGLLFFLASKQSLKISTLLFGLKICTNESVRVFLTMVATESNVPKKGNNNSVTYSN